MKKKSRLSVYKQHWPLYLMMLPGLLYLLINNYSNGWNCDCL